MNRRSFLAAGAVIASVLPEWWPPWDDPEERDLDEASLEELREELSALRDRVDDAEIDIDENRTGLDGLAETVTDQGDTLETAESDIGELETTQAEHGTELDALDTRLVDVETVADLVAVEDLDGSDGQVMVIESGVVLSADPADTESGMLGMAEYTAQWDGDNDELVFFVRDENNDIRQATLTTEEDDGGLLT